MELHELPTLITFSSQHPRGIYQVSEYGSGFYRTDDGRARARAGTPGCPRHVDKDTWQLIYATWRHTVIQISQPDPELKL